MLVVSEVTHRVGSLNTSVNNVGAHTLASATIISVGGGASAGVGETSQAPRSAGLGVEGVNLGVLLNVGDLFLQLAWYSALFGHQDTNARSVQSTYVGVVSESLNLLLGERSRETAQVLVDGVSLGNKGADSGSLEALASLELDNVGTLDELISVGDVERGPLRGSGSGQGQRSEESGGTHLEGLKVMRLSS